VSLFNVIDKFAIPQKGLVKMTVKNGEDKPAAPVKFNFLTLWRRLEEGGEINAEVMVELFEPHGLMLQRADYTINIAEKIKRLRSNVEWRGIRVTTPGTYVFKISIKEKGEKKYQKAGEIYLEIDFT
jgi:hypothetical protein